MRHGLSAGSTNLAGHGVRLLAISVHNTDRRTFSRERQARRLADTGGAAGDECFSALQQRHIQSFCHLLVRLI
jgi:hypothetical protein